MSEKDTTNVCLNCGVEIQQTPGRRPKKFCSDKCRQVHFQKHKPKGQKYVTFSTHQAALEKISALEAKLAHVSHPDTPTPIESEEKPKKPSQIVSNRISITPLTFNQLKEKASGGATLEELEHLSGWNSLNANQKAMVLSKIPLK